MRNGQIKVLLIEDDPGYARFVKEMLKDSKYITFKIETAHNLKKGLSRLKRKGIDVVLLDLMLPDSEGLDTFQSVYELKADIPIVVLSSFANEDVALNTVKIGAQDYLYKSEVNPGILIRSLSYAVERKSAEEKIRKAHDELEKRVDDRTSQLSKANKKLALEIKENEIIEDALRSSEEKYRLLVETSKDGIAVIQDAKLIFHNNIFEELLGYSEEELTDKPFINFIHPDDLEMVVDKNIRRLKGEDVEKTYEFRGLTKAGETLHLEMTVAMTEWEGKQASLCFLRDITKRKQSEELFLRYREELEQEVEERTVELKEINKKLATEVWKHKQTEQALEESENMARALLNTPIDTITMIDPEGNIIDLNDTIAERFNMKPSELKKLNIWELFPQEIVSKRKTFVDKVIDTGKPIRFDDEIDGIWNDNIINPIFDENGNVSKIAILSHDITNLKQIEEELRESELRYRTLFENSIEAVFTVDVKGNFTSANNAMAEILGYSSDEIIGTNCRKFSTPEVSKMVFNAYNDLYRTGKPIKDLNYNIIRKNGEVRTIDGYVNLVYEGNEIIGFQGTMRDVTDKIRSEQQLESRLNIQTALAEISRTIISDENPDINDILKILGEAIDVNRAYLFMVRENGTKIDNTHEWCDDKSEPQIQYLQDLDISLFSWSSKVMLTGESLNIPDVDALPEDASGEKEILKAQNIKSCLFVPVKLTDSKVIGFMGFDDTEKVREWLSEDLQALRIVAEMLEIFWARRRAEEERKRYAEELEKTNEEVKVFSYIVSHDLRNPLVNIKGLANILKESYEQINSKKDLLLQQLTDEERKEIETAISEDIPKALEFVDSTVKRMDNLINAIIKLSRFGRKELQFEVVDMNGTVKITLESLAHCIDKQGVVIKVGKLPPVFADLTSMLQIMGNIIANAIDYLDSDRKGKVEIGAVNGDNETTFYVKDNGRGIEEKDIEKIFQVFQRAGENDVPGEGMGLSYVKTLVERHGGKIWCNSKFGKGTTFTFTIRNNLKQRQ